MPRIYTRDRSEPDRSRYTDLADSKVLESLETTESWIHHTGHRVFACGGFTIA